VVKKAEAGGARSHQAKVGEDEVRSTNTRMSIWDETGSPFT